jgi:hypothetical protein
MKHYSLSPLTISDATIVFSSGLAVGLIKSEENSLKKYGIFYWLVVCNAGIDYDDYWGFQDVLLFAEAVACELFSD